MNYTFISKEINRGDIFYIKKNDTSCGSEQQAGRPAVVVSNDKNNVHCSTVGIVYLTTQDKEYLPTHVTVRSAPKTSTALCEQIHTVSKERVSDFCGVCSKDEMAAIDVALLISLSLEPVQPKKEKIEQVKDVDVQLPQQAKVTENPESLRAVIERDTYKNLYEDLLAKVMSR